METEKKNKTLMYGKPGEYSVSVTINDGTGQVTETSRKLIVISDPSLKVNS